MEHSPTSATGIGWEPTPWARDTASGAEGVEENTEAGAGALAEEW